MKIALRTGLFFLLGLFVFYPSLRGEFIMDDWGYITLNPMIRDSATPWIFWSSFASVDYWPLSYTVYWSLYRIFAENSLGYHLTSVLIHSANAALLWSVALTTPLTAPVAGFVAALFFLHPFHVQAVSWMIQIKTLLATLFFLLAFLAARRGWAARSVVAFALSLLAKTAAVTGPILFFFESRSWKRSAPYFALAAVFGVITVYVNDLHFAERSAEVFHLTWYERLPMMLQNLMFYLSTFVFPEPLAYIYPFRPPQGLNVRLIVLFAAAAVIGAIIFRAKRLTAGRMFFAGYLFLIFPALGMISIPNMKLSIVADHWAYLPDTFLCLAVGAWFAPYWGRRIGQAVLVAWLMGLTALTFRHAGSFATEQAFWERARDVNPASAVPHYNLGTVFGKRESHREAIRAYETALSIDPYHARAWFNKGRSHYLIGELGLAREAFMRAQSLDPKIENTYTALATIYLQMKDTKTALEILKTGLTNNPESAAIKQRLSESTSAQPDGP